jgi:hypothetical protein
MALAHKTDPERSPQESELSGRSQGAKKSEKGIKKGSREDNCQ